MNDLLKTRYLVTSNYPNSQFPKGIILERIQDATNNHFTVLPYNYGKPTILLEDIIKYPHIFKELKWWQNRSDAQMPSYVRLSKTIHKIDRWNYNYQDVRIADIPNKGITLIMSQHDFKPATEEEYLAYINSIANKNKCLKCDYELHPSGQCVNQFCDGYSRRLDSL